MKYTTEDIGKYIREVRKKQKMTQEQLAFTCGTGVRFIVDLEKGKPTCEFGKVLYVMQMLGIEVVLNTPSLKGP